MAHITLSNITLTFPIYGMNSRSLKQQLLHKTTGGQVASGAHDSVEVHALNKLSLNLKDGDRLGLTGHNGAGKSSLLRVMAGIYHPTQGHVDVEGSLGVLIDPMAGINVEVSGLDNIYLRGYALGLTRSQISDMIDDVIEFSGLGEFIHMPVKTYSAGMVTRLGFSISTSIKTDILLVDEGLGAADAEFQEQLNQRIGDFYNSVKILVLASHSEPMIEKYCTSRLSMSEGAIVSHDKIG
ncbi:MAG: ABC transporter ATP-binding protein [Rhodobiaceae bacterium]|nr:ABC transporter ATP-binding protein [Rhodobiaceae bacterium]